MSNIRFRNVILNKRNLILETEFTPISSLAGGALIGLSAVMLMLTQGKIAGIRGMVSRILPPSIDKKEFPQSILFIIGLLIAGPIWYVFFGEIPSQTVSNNLVILSSAGLLVGFGAVLGNGCTSGHGVCGLSRASIRSLVVTITFMLTGFITVFILRNIMGL